MGANLDPFDVEALEKSLNDSATRVSSIWVSFLVFGLYLVITAGTVTHRQLLLEDPLKLPVLNIDLPLVGFFFLAPILLVVFHGYVLIQVLLLARTAASYSEALKYNIKIAADNARVRQRLANTLFAQIFAGSPRERDGWLGWLLKVMAWLTLAVAPTLILLLFQFNFLPYHSHLVTWTLRLLTLVELTTVFLLWPLALDPERDIEWRRVVTNPIALAAVALFGFISLSLFTFPGEPHINRFAGQPLDTVECKRWFYAEDRGQFLAQYWARWNSFDRLVLPLDVVDDEKLAKIEKATADRKLQPYEGERTRIFRDRDLNCSDLADSDLRRVDLTAAQLVGANLNRADLRGASIDFANLRRASLHRADLRNASLKHARLHSASLMGAQLQGAFLEAAMAYGANLSAANLDGAYLRLAMLSGAILSGTLRGANLQSAKLQGANLSSAWLEGALLDYAELQGASLFEARLGGASLVRAQLQGADLRSIRLTDAKIGAAVWRAQLPLGFLFRPECGGAHVQEIDSASIIQFYYDEKLIDLNGEEVRPIQATPEAISSFIEESVSYILDSEVKETVKNRMRYRLIVDPIDDDVLAKEWAECKKASTQIPQVEFDKRHADFLRDLACDANVSRNAIAKGIISNWISVEKDRRDFSAQLARGLLGEGGKHCFAAKDFDEDDKEKLREAITLIEAQKASSLAVPAPSPVVPPPVVTLEPDPVRSPAQRSAAPK
ncbi:pentapeptide repeat-containing protein [Bradyrhizobium sp. 27S5]|uniref:pentapeptide repeat-containing protein n=1 Tax=Bradyrhizobium sp. 27S5 TaxID=3139728 RepID=UPI0030D491C0